MCRQLRLLAAQPSIPVTTNTHADTRIHTPVPNRPAAHHSRRQFANRLAWSHQGDRSMMPQRRNILAGLSASIPLASQQVGAQMLPPPTGLPAGSVEPIGSHVVSYIEVEPGSEDRAVAIVRAMRTASLKDAGIKSFVILQIINSRHHFSVLEEWADNAARQTHLTQPHLTATRESLRRS